MSADVPTRDELARSMTVEVERKGATRIVGEIGAVLSNEQRHPDEIMVKLKSGVKGCVERIAPDA